MELFKLLGTIAINNSDAKKALKETSGEAKKTAGDLGSVSESSEKTSSKWASAFKKIGSGALVLGKGIAIGIGASATALGGLTAKALSAAGELEQNMGGSEAVFKEHAASIQKTAKEAFSNMGLSTSDYLATANKMGALFQGAGFEIEESMKLSQDAMQRAADVASIMGIDTESAMEAVAGAAKGNFTMMDNLGVAMNETALANYALEKGMKKSYDQMTQQEKIGVAMEMFMDKTAYAAGNYAKENETLAGSLGTAKAALSNFLSGAGTVEDVVSSFSNAADVIIKNVDDIFPKLMTGITQLVEKIAPMIPSLLQKVLPGLIEGATTLINGLVSALPALIDVLTNSALPQVLTGIVAIINSLIEALPQIIESLVAALPTLIPLLIDALVSVIVTLCTKFGEIIQPIIDHLPEILVSIGEALLKNLPILIDGLIQLALGIAKVSLSIWSPVGKAFVDYFGNVWKDITNVFSNIGNWFRDKFSDAWGKVKNVFSNVKGFFLEKWNQIKEVFSSLGTTISDSISGAVKAGINSLISGAENIINGFFKMINNAIGAINEIPGVNISKIKLVEFTRLAKGGVVDKPTPAIFGEDGAEAVVPLEHNTEWMNKVATKLHELTVKQNGGGDGAISQRSVELQQLQASKLDALTIIVNKILEALFAMDENMGGHLREALEGVSLGVNKREFARLVKEVN